jgi:alpha-tubulin suppressor-like RCC1 family protein
MRKISGRVGAGVLLMLVAAAPVNPAGAAQPAVEAGFYVSYALTRDGRLYAWGANFHGQLANGTFTTNEPYGSSVPLLVSSPGGTGWSAVRVGLSHSLALANNGNLYSWGRSDAGELGTGHAMVTRSDVEVPKPAGVTRWRAIAAGEEHSVAIGDNGQLYAWGDNFYGQLGNGDNFGRPAPTRVTLPEGVTHWTDVWAGGHCTFARGNDGKVYGWGRNREGELGIGTVNSEGPFDVSSPVTVLLPAGVTGWKSIAVGRYHTLALDDQGRLYGWGSNEQGGLGYQITGIQSTPIPLAPPAGVSNWRTLSASEGHNLAISGDGRLFSWGFAAGNGSHTPAVVASSRTNWSAIGAGVAHNVAVASDCSLYAWGWQYYGSLGNDNPSGRSYPTPELVRGLPDLCDTPPGTRELHVVGVHAGAGTTSTYQRGDASLWVDRPQKRVILFLSSYSPVRWYINVSVGTVLERVILGGYYRQTVEGVGPETEVIPAWFVSGARSYIFIGSSLEEAAFYEAKPRLCAMTGLDISSFHGSPVAPYPNAFIIDRIQDDERLRCDYPQPTPASELPQLSFRIAFHNQSPTGNVVFQNYTLAGPQSGERLLPAMRVVPDAGGRYYYGTENHQVWKVDSQAGTAQQMILPSTVPTLSWPMGMAFDSERDRVLLVSLGGEGYLYGYSPPANQWSVVRNMANLDLDSLEYDPAADVLYSISVNGSGGRALIYRLSPQGAVVGEILLPLIPIRFGPGGYRTELVSVGEYLVLLVEPTYLYPSDTSVQESRIYLIDPRSGQSWLTYRRAYLPENKRPTVQVVWPAEGMTLPAGTTVPLGADAADPDGLVDVVEFFANGTSLGRGRRSSDSSTTFQLDWLNPLPGSYALTARATDALGLSTVSSVVHTSIREGEPPPPVSERELHAVGISSGVNADGTPLTSNGQGHAGVAVNRSGKRVTLFLSSYGPVLWHVVSSNGTIIEKVILGGYYAQAITGLSSNVPVERAYYDGQSSDYLNIGWTIESGDFYRTVQRLCERTGLDLASFHGAVNPPYPAPFVIDSVQNDARLRCDYPRPVEPSHLPNLGFRLAWNSRNNGTILFRDYTLAGPQNGSHLLAGYRVVADAGGRYYYGAEQHEVWRVDSQTSTVQQMTLPSNLPELSWPMGSAFDSRRNRIVVVTLGGEGFLYAYSPPQDQWSLLRSMGNRDVNCLVYHAADDSFYAVAGPYEGAPSLLRLNAAGELQSEIRLPVQPFRIGHGEAQSELASVGDYLVLLLETDAYFAYLYPDVQAESRMYLIDPRTGQVSLTYRRVLFPDQDDDGVPDDRDRCPGTALGAVVDANGCSAAQRDSDGDGVTDDRDQCPDTPAGTVVDGNGCLLPPVAANDQLNPAVASDGTNFLVVWWDRRNADSTEFDIYGARVSAMGEVLDPGGIAICTARDYQLYPAVAFDGQNYLVVWTDARDNSVQPYSLELYGARVTPGGVVLDPNGFRITHGEVALNPTVTFNGIEHLVVAYAREHNGRAGSTLLGVRVTPAGQVRDTEELILREPQGPEYPVSVASLERDWLVVWNLGGIGAESVRVSRNGNVSSPVKVLNDGNTWFHSLAAAGSNYFLASVVDRQIGQDTHVLDVFGTWITPDGRPRETVLIAANTNQTIGSHLQPTTYMQINPAVAANGTEVMVIWEAGAMYTNGGYFAFLSDIRGAKVNASGTISPVISVCSAPQDQSYSAVAFNGQHFLATWQDARTAPPEEYSPFGHFDIYGARLTTAGRVIETNGFLISGFTAPSDDDNDGVPNDRDQCPSTPAGAVVNAQGCSIAQLCPCDGPWGGHGEYVQCVMDHAWGFYRQGLIDEHERRAITRAAARSDCGSGQEREPVRIHLCPQTREECQRDGLRIVLSGDAAGEHIIESSTDLINWSPVEAGKVTVIGDEIVFPVASDVAARFYRIRIQ